MRWIFPNGSCVEKERVLSDAVQVPQAVSELLIRRGFETVAKATEFLNPKLALLGDPFVLGDMDRAVDRVLSAIDGKKRIVVYGDYDVDGVTSVALLTRLLKEFGGNVQCFLPTREGEGYGLSEKGLSRCRETLDPELLVAVDCGTSSGKEIAKLREDGIEVVVLDHHEGASQKPVCEAFVNPKVEGCFEYLCSVGIVFKLGHALMKQRRVQGVDLREYLDLVALGTLSDLVPLKEENRILVKKGLQQIGDSRWAGVRALLAVSGVQKPVEAVDVGFKLGPRVNAAGRLGSAQTALDLLLTEDEHEALRLAEELDLRNRDRRDVEDQVYKQAEEQIQRSFNPDSDRTIVVGSEGWHPGVVGIVASRIMRKYYRPTLVVAFDAEGNGKGSGRSIRGLPLVEALSACSAYLTKFGGHEMAAGISVKQHRFESFREAFESYARKALQNEALEPFVEIDAELLLRDVNERMLKVYEALAPFGMGNPQPLFALRGVTPEMVPRRVKEKHLQITFRQGHDKARAIWFNAPSEPLPAAPWDVAFELGRNAFQGVVTAQIVIKALRAAE